MQPLSVNMLRGRKSIALLAVNSLHVDDTKRSQDGKDDHDGSRDRNSVSWICGDAENGMQMWCACAIVRDGKTHSARKLKYACCDCAGGGVTTARRQRLGRIESREIGTRLDWHCAGRKQQRRLCIVHLLFRCRSSPAVSSACLLCMLVVWRDAVLGIWCDEVSRVGAMEK